MLCFRLLLFSTVALLPAVIHGQSSLDGFDPNANGAIRVIVVQPDGKILIGGDFTSLAPNGGAAVARNRIARLKADGTLDTAFDPNATGTVNAIALQADGKILVGGSFASIGGQMRNNIARLDAITGLADSFDPNSSSTVFAVAVQADGRILAGGFFNNIGGQPRNRLARLDPASGLADSFDPNPGGGVTEIFAITVQSDAKILVGGFFATIGGQTRNNLARLDPATGLADSFSPNASDEVHCIAVQADGKVLAGGFFTIIGGQTRNSIGRLDAVTGAADSFDPNANNGVFAVVVQADGKILAGGDFFGIGGQQRHFIARLDSTTGLADSFDPSGNNVVRSIVQEAGGKILVGGGLTTLSPNGGAAVTRNHIARLETDGRLDQTLNLNAVGTAIRSIAVQPDGKIVIGGQFNNILGVARSNIARLNSDGTLDVAFNPNANGNVASIVVQTDGKILVGGQFHGTNSIGGQTRNFFARLDPVTGLADSFNPSPNDDVYAIALQADGMILIGGFFDEVGGPQTIRPFVARLDPVTGLADSFNPSPDNTVLTMNVQSDGKILIGGFFTSVNGGPTRNRIARIDPVSGVADSFDPNPNNDVYTIVIQPDGKILVGGAFNGANGIGGQTRNRIARLDPSSGLADSFNPNANNTVFSMALRADGKIFAGGLFSGANSIGGQTRNRIARLDPSTGLADSFDPNANNFVASVALQPDGKLLVGGFFNGANSIGGQARSFFARLSNDIGAQQVLAVTRTAISWTRGGSSPQFKRVAFEGSTDNVTYTVLGNATAVGSDWSLTGLNLPTEQNIYVRARGYYSGGQSNASESVQQAVRNAFLRQVSLANVVSRKTHGGNPFDINLPIAGSGIECRGTDGNYKLVFAFANTLTSVGNASVTNGAGTVSSHMMDADAHNYIVNLSGVANAQTITVTLTNVNDSAGNSSASVPISFGLLQGDTNGDGSVNSGDIAQTKSKSGQTVDVTNFRTDVNADGSLNSADISLVKSKSGTGFCADTAAERAGRY